MQSWAEEQLRILRDKESELARQLMGVRTAIAGIEQGFALEPLPALPRILQPDSDTNLPTWSAANGKERSQC